MKVRPIIFSGPMVRALLDGRKTQTRRAIAPQPLYFTGRTYVVPDGAPKAWRDSDDFTALCPYGVAGDLLYVREAWAPCGPNAYPLARMARSPDGRDGAFWREGWDRSKPSSGWKPSIHMPRWASRLTLEITGVRVERLQGIGEDDALAEGISPVRIGSGYPDRFTVLPASWADVVEGRVDNHPSPVSAFGELWKRINGEGAWEANPWIWALAFRVHRRNVDELLRRREAA